jgi:tRNA A-37 threonylcarbamoyl transferase component Bud32
MINFDVASLIWADLDLREPFVLSLICSDGEKKEITVQKILRLLPRKRIVAVAKVNGKKYLVKIFIGRYSGRYAKREVAGAAAIEDAGVLTPLLEWQALRKSAKGHVVGFEYISDAKDLLEVWKEAENDEQRLSLIGKVVPALAAMHEGGVVQNDIHPENFLFRSGLIYTIDGGDVAQHGKVPLGSRKSLSNMALFFAQFHARHDHLVSEWFEQYRQLRAWPVDKGRYLRLINLIGSQRSERKKEYIDKAFRECTRFVCENSFRRFLVCERQYDSPEMRELLSGIDERMESGKLLKDGSSATVALVDGPSGPLVVKRYNIKGAAHGFSRAFRKSRAWVSWANANRLDFLGISTVKPVALVEERFGPLRRKAYFVTEYIDGPDATVLAEKKNPMAEMASIVDMLKELAVAGVSHGDLKASNFLLGNDGPVIIDLDSMKEHTNPVDRDRAKKKDIARFMRNWESIPWVKQRFAELLG